jgi:hypothetical protein
MLSLTGRLVHVFRSPDGISKEGEAYSGSWKGQILAAEGLKNGSERHKLFDLRTDSPGAFEGLTGQLVKVQVRAYALGRDVGYSHVPDSVVECVETAKGGKDAGRKPDST